MDSIALEKILGVHLSYIKENAKATNTKLDVLNQTVLTIKTEMCGTGGLKTRVEQVEKQEIRRGILAAFMGLLGGFIAQLSTKA